MFTEIHCVEETLNIIREILWLAARWQRQSPGEFSQKKEHGTTIKHFACNSQEDDRIGSNSICQERALREIYLRGFEIAVKTSQPMAIMTSYN